MSIATVTQAIRALRRAQDALSAAVADTWGVGADIRWKKYGHLQIGHVVAHGGCGRYGEVLVHNERTGKQYWITMYDVLGYVEQ